MYSYCIILHDGSVYCATFFAVAIHHIHQNGNLNIPLQIIKVACSGALMKK